MKNFIHTVTINLRLCAVTLVTTIRHYFTKTDNSATFEFNLNLVLTKDNVPIMYYEPLFGDDHYLVEED